MKKLFALCFLVFSMFSFAQETSDSKTYHFPKNELKINVIYPFWEKIEISYERSLNDRFSLGVSAFTDLGEVKNSSFVSPYFRYYLGKKPSEGLYLEAQSLFSTKNNTFFSVHSDQSKILFGGGFGGGYKLTTKKNWIFDANAVLGGFVNASPTTSKTYFRFGLSVGKRF